MIPAPAGLVKRPPRPPEAAGEGSSGPGSSGISVFPMLDPIEIDAFRRVVDPIEHAIVPDPEAIAFFSRQFQTTDRPGLSRQAADLFDDAGKARSFELVEVPLSRREDEDIMHGGS